MANVSEPLARQRIAAQSIRVDGLMATDGFRRAVGLLAEGFIAVHVADPRPAALFATQQRWLLCQAALAQHFRASTGGGPGVTRSGLGHLALVYGVASRNTAYAFFDEALKYDIVRPLADGETVVPSPATLSLLKHWYDIHLRVLDVMDGQDRSPRFQADPDGLARMAPPVADALLASRDVRAPGPLYTIFAWADVGGLLVDRLVAGIDWQVRLAHGGYLTNVTAISDLARAFGLSRAHASRKLAAAESIGGLGWTGRRGHSRIWISSGFYAEYAEAQARKLLIIDKAFSAAVAVDRVARG